MNEIMKFEGNQVDIILINEQPHFEVYSTGMALGQVVTAKGKIYPNKERIDKNIKNAEISTVLRNAKQYISESQLYDLMLEVKTSKCRAFRKWVTKEVLPSIRKTGTYSLSEPQPQQMELAEPYEHKPKYYKGVQVATVSDLEYFMKVSAFLIRDCLKRNKNRFAERVDFWDLKGADLAEFKENNKLCKTISSLLIFSESGFKKLNSLMGNVPTAVRCFEKCQSP